MPRKMPFKYKLWMKDEYIYFKIYKQSAYLYKEEVLEQLNNFLTENGSNIVIKSMSCPEIDWEVIYLRGDLPDEDTVTAIYYTGETDERQDIFNRYQQALLYMEEFCSGEYRVKSNPIIRKIHSLTRRFKSGTLRKVVVQKLPLGA